MDIFEITNVEQQTHLFRTDNAQFQQLGLGVFTTGILYEYFNELDSMGQPANRQDSGSFVEKEDGGPLQNVEDILGKPDSSSSQAPKWGSWEGFRKLEITGKYEDQTIREWTLSEFGLDVSYNMDGNWLRLFNVKKEGIPNKATPVLKEGEITGFEIGRTDFYPLATFGKAEDKKAEAIEKAGMFIYSYRSVVNVIAMNDFMISVKQQVPRSKWKTLEGGTINKTNLFAMDEYLSDIKSSKSNSIVGSGLVTFNVEMAGGKFQCPIQDYVSWELMLKDQPSKKKAEATAIVSNQLVADYKKDETNRQYRSSVDGAVTTPDTTKENQKTVAPMELTYNAYKDKWQSGTASIMGYVFSESGIAAAQTKPDLDRLAQGDVQQIVNSEDESQKVVFATGLVMPVHMQNGNPYQWAPNYAKDDDCRAGDKKKQNVLAYNFNSKKGYEKGDMVILSEIGGVWHIQDPGIGLSEREIIAEEPKWAMTYHMTSRDYFFRVPLVTGEDDQGKPLVTYEKITPSYMERYHHLCYYKDDPKNNGGKTDSYDPKGREYNDQFDSSVVDKRIAPFALDGTFQITSFDFMDKRMFGTRGRRSSLMDRNALNTTQAEVDAGGRTVPLYNSVRNAAHSGPFFGCVFPDGYQVSEELKNTKTDRDFNICYHNSGAIEDNKTQGKGTYTLRSQPPKKIALYSAFDGGMGEGFFESLDSNVSNSGVDQHPFIDPPMPDDAFDDKRPKYALGVRSDARSAVTVWGDEEFDPNQEEWIRLSNKQGPSMFQLFTKGTDKTLQQLPADIATNAHIDNPNGGPLWSVHRTYEFYRDWQDISTTDYQDEVPKAFATCAWLRKRKPQSTDDNGVLQDPEYSASDSAFGFEPKRANKIQFRPLKMELYASFHEKLFDPETLARKAPYWSMRIVDVDDPGEGYDDGDPDRLMVPDRYLQNPCDKPDVGQPTAWCNFPQVDRRASWSCAIARHYISNQLPVDTKFIYERETQISQLPVYFENSNGSGTLPYMAGDAKYFWGNTNSFRYHNRWYWNDINMDKNGDPVDDANPFRWQDDLDDLRYNDDLGIGVAGGSSIGVISAVATTNATQTITFDTKNYFGMASVYWKPLKAGNFFTYPEKEIPSWGGGGVNTYSSNNTYHLATTVYHAHPREQTILDPQYFAVHHYNPRPELQGCFTGDWPDPEGNLYYLAYYEDLQLDASAKWPFTQVIPYKDIEITIANDVTGDFDKGIEPVGIRELSYPPETDGGAPIPVWHYHEDTNDGSRGNGKVVFQNGVLGSYNRPEPIREVLPMEISHLNVTRVGKLLPYTYLYNATTFPNLSWEGEITDNAVRFFVLPVNEDVVMRQELEREETVVELVNNGYKIIISNNGTGYQPGDKVGDPESGLEFTVDIIGQDGEIYVLAYERKDGKRPEEIAIDYSRGFPSDKVISKGSTGIGGLSMQNIESANGSGFEMSFLYAERRWLYGTDQKPRYLERELQLSADADSKDKQIAYGAQEFGFVNEDITSVIFVGNDPSPNKKYDMFFQAHNDTIFTWFNSDLIKDYYNADSQNCPADEQFINLTFLGE